MESVNSDVSGACVHVVNHLILIEKRKENEKWEMKELR